jgi:hypothetical protein
MERILLSKDMLSHLGLDVLENIHRIDYRDFHKNFFERHYHRFSIDDKNTLSGTRKNRKVSKIVTPEMKAVQKVTLQRLHEVYGDNPKSGISEYKGSSLKNLLRHMKTRKQGKRFVPYFPRFYYAPDLQSAFDHVWSGNLEKLLRRDFSDNLLKEKIELLSCRHDRIGLTQGSHLSNLLFFLYCRKYIDYKLEELCKQYEITGTRYVDDFLFSSDYPIDHGFTASFRKIIREAGFELNFTKTKHHDIAKKPMNVNGFVFKKHGNLGIIGISKKHRRTISGTIHQCKAGKVKLPQVTGHIGPLVKISRIRDGYFLNTSDKRVLNDYQKLLLNKVS